MIVAGAASDSEGVVMGSGWKTKYGMRRVRVDPPTLEEALYAAEGLTPDANEQLQIAAALMDLPVDTVRAEAQRVTRRSARATPSLPRRPSGSLIVETKHSRRFASRR